MAENTMNIYEKLSSIQCELKAPKNQYNDYGNFYYRNCEDILEAAKPLCNKHKLTLILADELQSIGNRNYIMAIAKLQDWESRECISVTAYARESDIKKGMDDSQITGSTSSYARKYALNGLFNIDDTKDADTNEFKKQNNKNKQQQNVSKEDVGKLLVEWTSIKNELSGFGVDVHNEGITKWILDKTGLKDINPDINDAKKMHMLIQAASVLLDGKKKASENHEVEKS